MCKISSKLAMKTPERRPHWCWLWTSTCRLGGLYKSTKFFLLLYLFIFFRKKQFLAILLAFCLLFAFSFNEETFAIVILFLLRLRATQKALELPFFYFPFSYRFFGRNDESFLSVYDISLHRTRVTSIGPVSLDTLVTISWVICLLLLETRVTHIVQ